MTKRVLSRLLTVALLMAACVSSACRRNIQQGPDVLRMTVSLYRTPAAEELAGGETLQARARVRVKSRRPPWVLVGLGEVEGWLPEWYLTWELTDDVVEDFEPYCMVVKEETDVKLFPDESADTILDLQAGKVVRVCAEFQNWRYVRIAVYDIPNILRGWVNQDSLVDLAEGHPMEGKILPGTTVFFGDPRSQGFDTMVRERISQVMIVYLGEEIGDMVHVSAAGGWDAWVSRSNIVFEPFDK